MRPASGAARVAAAVVAGAAVLVPLVLALTDSHLTGAPVLLVASTAAGTVAVAALGLQPWLVVLRRSRRARAHTAVGVATALLVAVHVAALVVLEPDDAAFAMSTDGPTRARMALLATVLLVVVVALGLLRRRLGWSGPTWRLLHGGFALLAVVLGVGHAVLTDGALDGVGTAVLLSLGVLGVLGAVVAAVSATSAARLRRAPPPVSGAAPASGRARADAPGPTGPR